MLKEMLGGIGKSFYCLSKILVIALWKTENVEYAGGILIYKFKVLN